MTQRPDYSDLTARSLSAVVMVVVAGIALWQGGVIFDILLLIAGGLMVWEVSAMHRSDAKVPVIIAAIAGVLLACLFFLPQSIPVYMPLVGMLVFAITASLMHEKKHQKTVAMGLLAVFATAGVLSELRTDHGLMVTLWILLCISASDVGGYFAGKTFGGPKLWTRISPKKTWSGTIGGWIFASFVGACFYYFGAQPVWFIPASVLVAMAAQSGDLAESAMKRRAGIKDSSHLIPGHGGLLDRFDGALGVCTAILVLAFFGIV